MKRIRKPDLVGRSVSLEVGFEISKYLVSFSLPIGQIVELSVSSPAPCLYVYYHASFYDDNGLPTETVIRPQLNAFIRVAFIMVSLHRN